MLKEGVEGLEGIEGLEGREGREGIEGLEGERAFDNYELKKRDAKFCVSFCHGLFFDEFLYECFVFCLDLDEINSTDHVAHID